MVINSHFICTCNTSPLFFFRPPLSERERGSKQPQEKGGYRVKIGHGFFDDYGGETSVLYFGSLEDFSDYISLPGGYAHF